MQKDFDLVFEPIKQGVIRCGCYAINPQLLKQMHNQHVLVPLKTSDYHLEVANSITNINLTQLYHNPTHKFLELEYHFPINPDACVYKFTASFGNYRIEGVVKEKEQAKKEYKEAVEQGRRAAYGEFNPDSKDILSLKIGNVPPKESVKIQISYLQELSLSNNTFYQLHMIGTISPRYMNFLSAKQIAAGLRNSGAKTRGDFYWNFRISLKTSRKVIFCRSHTHDIQLISQNDSKTETQLAMTQESIPNKDFVFSFSTENFELPSYVFGRTDAGSTAMLSFIPKFCNLSLDDAYKASIQGKNFEVDIGSARGEYIFFLDRSGSMYGNRIQRAKEALVLFIKSLPEDTYFNIVSFGTETRRMFDKSVKYSDKQIDKAVQMVQNMKADMGGNNIFQPLYATLLEKPFTGYAKQIFLLTDGGEPDIKRIVDMVAVNNKYSRVHTIGIGNGCAQELILGCAKKGKGYHVFIGDNQNPSTKIIQLLSDSLTPLINKINLKFDKQLVESVIPNPQSMPYLLKNEIINFYITFKGQLQKPTTFNFSYENTTNKLPFSSDILIDPTYQSEPFVDKMGHFRRIKLMQDSQKSDSNLQDMMYYVKKVDKKAAIINQSVKHQILSQLTAFICVEKELVDGRYEEVKGKGDIKIKIQNPPPIQYQPIHYATTSQYRCMPSSKMSYHSQEYEQCSMSIVSDLSFKKSSRINISTEYCQKGNAKKGCIGGSQPPALKKKQAPTKNQGFFSSLFSSDKPKYAMKEEIKEQKKSYDDKISTIDRIVGRQAADGSWKDLELVGELFGQGVRTRVKQQKNMLVVITYLVSKWIEKHYPESQYSLVVRKGQSFIKKNAVDLQVMEKSYAQYVK